LNRIEDSWELQNPTDWNSECFLIQQFSKKITKIPLHNYQKIPCIFHGKKDHWVKRAL
jgi:hypothetical protein